MGKRCSSCGTENRDDAKFCKNCGTSIAVVAPPTPAPHAEMRSPVVPTAGDARPSRALTWATAAVVIVAVAGGGWWWMNQAKKPVPAVTTAPQPAFVPSPTSTPAPQIADVAATFPSAQPQGDSATVPGDTAAPAQSDTPSAQTPAEPSPRAVVRPLTSTPQSTALPARSAREDSRAKAEREARARAAEEMRNQDLAQAQREAARKEREADGAAVAVQPPPMAREALPAVAQPVKRTARELCADRPNIISRGICESRECEKPEHREETLCKQMKDMAERRPD